MAVSRQDASRHPLPEPLQRTLERLGFVCEDEVWNGWQRPHAFRCSAGHALALAPARLSNLLGCRACHGRRTVWQCLRLAAERLGVECLDNAWRGRSAMHRFRCCVGHEWQRSGRDALDNLFCPRCISYSLALKRADGVLRLYEAVAGRGGAVLPGSGHFGLEWRYGFVCRYGHEWRTNARGVLNGSWCPVCARWERNLCRNCLQIHRSGAADGDRAGCS